MPTDDSTSSGPAPSPELPIINISVDGNLNAVDFIRRLHRAGLELVNADDGSYAVLRLAEGEESPPIDQPEQPRERGARRLLFQASGIVHAVRTALDCSDHIDIDEVQLASALEAAGKLIDDAASALEGSSHD